jgi:membrane glycosyltransferase
MKDTGKTFSKGSMILAVIILIGTNLYSIIAKNHIPTIEEEKTLIMFCSAIVLFFSPVILSIWFKIFCNRNKEENK